MKTNRENNNKKHTKSKCYETATIQHEMNFKSQMTWGS